MPLLVNYDCRRQMVRPGSDMLRPGSSMCHLGGGCRHTSTNGSQDPLLGPLKRETLRHADERASQPYKRCPPGTICHALSRRRAAFPQKPWKGQVLGSLCNHRSPCASSFRAFSIWKKSSGGARRVCSPQQIDSDGLMVPIEVA